MNSDDRKLEPRRSSRFPWLPAARQPAAPAPGAQNSRRISDDVLTHVTSFLSQEEKWRLRRTCKVFYEAFILQKVAVSSKQENPAISSTSYASTSAEENDGKRQSLRMLKLAAKGRVFAKVRHLDLCVEDLNVPFYRDPDMQPDIEGDSVEFCKEGFPRLESLALILSTATPFFRARVGPALEVFAPHAGITRIDIRGSAWRPGDITFLRFPNLKAVVTCTAPPDNWPDQNGSYTLDPHPSIEEVGVRGDIYIAKGFANFSDASRFPALRRVYFEQMSLDHWRELLGDFGDLDEWAEIERELGRLRGRGVEVHIVKKIDL